MNNASQNIAGFQLITPDNVTIRFRLYWDDAPVTTQEFVNALPFSRTFYHARVSGREIWIDDAPQLSIIQENASVFVTPGEVAITPITGTRNKTAGCMGIFYGEGSLMDCSNIFAKVYQEDSALLEQLGNNIWKHGAQHLSFEKI